MSQNGKSRVDLAIGPNVVMAMLGLAAAIAGCGRPAAVAQSQSRPPNRRLASDQRQSRQSPPPLRRLRRAERNRSRAIRSMRRAPTVTCKRSAPSARGSAVRPACGSSFGCCASTLPSWAATCGFSNSWHPTRAAAQKVQLVNMIVEWHPEKKERILLCAHYDTRPLPDRDPDPAHAPQRHVHRRE